METALALSDCATLGVDDPRQRVDVSWLEAILRDVDAAPRKVDAMRTLVARYPDKLTFGSLRRKYYEWRDAPEAQKREALIDRRKLRKLKTDNAFVESYRYYCEKFDRDNAAAYKHMMALFIGGAPLEHLGTWREVYAAEFPNAPVPPKYPVGWTPKGMHYATLQRAAKASPNYNFSILASRQGTKASRAALLPVLRSRAGLLPGQVYQFDDVHVDVMVRMDGSKIARPLMFTGYDVASGHRIAWASRPQFEDEKTGRKSSLKEKEFRYLVADVAINKGFHRDGVRLIVEHGTTAIRPTLELKMKAIPRYGNLIDIERGGVLCEAVHPGAFTGNGGGNFRLKAYCERAHRTYHNARAMLEGRTGQDSDHMPESLPALVRYEEKLMRIAQALPAELAEKIVYNLLDWREWQDVEMRIADMIAHDHDHQLEGWSDRREKVWRYTDKSEWLDWAALEALPEQDRAAVLLLLKHNPALVAVRRMSRAQVWQRGADELVRIPLIELPNLLEQTDARVVKVRTDGTIGFRDTFYFGDDEMIYHAQVTTAQGYRQALAPHTEWLLYVTPYNTEAGVIVAPQTGDIVGTIPMYRRAPWADRHALEVAMGKQNADKAKKLLDLRGRHQRDGVKRLATLGHNEDVISSAVAVSKANPFKTPGGTVIDFGTGGAPLSQISSLGNEDIYRDEDDGDGADSVLAQIAGSAGIDTTED